MFFKDVLKFSLVAGAFFPILFPGSVSAMDFSPTDSDSTGSVTSVPMTPADTPPAETSAAEPESEVRSLRRALEQEKGNLARYRNTIEILQASNNRLRDELDASEIVKARALQENIRLLDILTYLECVACDPKGCQQPADIKRSRGRVHGIWRVKPKDDVAPKKPWRP